MDNQNNMYNNIPNMNPKGETPEEKKAGNMWSMVSLLCAIFSRVVTLGILAITGTLSAIMNTIMGMDTSFMNDRTNAIAGMLGGVASTALLIAALVIIIYVRVKYPKNTFGKVLMWIYIVLFAIFIIIIAAAIIACGVACGACVDAIEGCGRMGRVIIEGYKLC